MKKFYLVGGAPRDILMSVSPKDYDFVVVGASPDDFKECQCVGKDFPVFLEPTYGWEVALARIECKVGCGYTGFESDWKGVTLEEDLARRDLTLNSIAIEVDWETTLLLGEPVTIGTWIDPFNGISDIKNRVLPPTTQAFQEDAIRLLRAGRFLARYNNFVVSEDLIAQCKNLELSGELLSLVPERVWLETEKALKEKSPSKYFEFISMFDFPFVEFLHDMKLTGENNAWHREDNVFLHTMMVLGDAANRFKDPEINFAPLLHDIAKPKCYSERGKGYGHDAEGVPMIEEFCKQWKVPNNYRDLAKITCEQHQKVHGVLGRDANKWSRPKSIMKIFEQTSAISKPERFKKMLKVCESDHWGRISDEVKSHYLQRPYLEECLQAVLDLDTKTVSKEMLEKGKSGVIIGQSIREARIDEIRKVQNMWKNNVKEK
jgi:tRNA nucleotidyltransferase (CCA-adding enzyme)